MMRRAALIGTLALILLLVAGSLGLYWITLRALPQYQGDIRLAGLSAPVTVRFGPHAIPTIEAVNHHDLMFAQGYVVASERMWQMDLMRRLAGGRLAELLGPALVPVDRFFRTIDLDQDVARSLAALGEQEQALLAAYAEGVNAYRETARKRRRLPLEYLLIGAKPVPWTPQDSLLVGSYMAWTQSFNVRSELTFLRLAARLGPELARELFPVDVGTPAPPVPPALSRALAHTLAISDQEDPNAAPLFHEQVDALIARLGLPLAAAASNGWAVTGQRTLDGGALLANDPHLTASMPGIWYELELIAPGLQVAGASLPGVPLVMIGHNRDLAWGFTSVIADTQDLFIERVKPDGRHVERPTGTFAPIETRIERILVRKGDPVELSIRSTDLGVIVNDILGPLTETPMDLPSPSTPYLLALRRCNDQPDMAFAGLLRLNQARSLEEASEAVLDFKHVVLNLLLAHRDGRIGWQMSGLLPLRGKGSGAFPSPGWAEGYGWTAYLPQRMNPRLLDPEGDILVNANNRSVPADHPVTVSNAWMAPFRAERIRARIDAHGPLTPESMSRIQSDRVSRQARLAQAALRELEHELSDTEPMAWAIATNELLQWDGEMSGDSRTAALYALLEAELFRALYEDELGEDLETLSALSPSAYSPFQETLVSGRSSFWNDIRTPETEDPAKIWARSLLAAQRTLEDMEAHAEAVGALRLDQLRTLVFPHPFGTLPLIGRLFNVGPLGVGGHSDTVNLMKTMPLTPGEGVFVPSMRVVFTPGDWRQTRGIQPLGQSGHLLSPYRTDQLDAWLRADMRLWPWNGPDTEETIGVRTLSPLH